MYPVSQPVEVICGAQAHACRCGLALDHEEEAHICADPECNGSWIGELDGDIFRVIRFPMAQPR